MLKSSRVVTSTSCPTTATSPVTVTCPTFTTRPATTVASMMPTAVSPAMMPATTAGQTVCPPGFVCVPATQAAAMQAATTPTITTPMVTTPMAPTTTTPMATTTDMLNSLLGQLGLAPTTTPTTPTTMPTTMPAIPPSLTPTITPSPVSGISPTSTPGQIFSNPIADLGALNPFAALAASNPTAALAALSPALNIFNPAINPNAALLSANPAAASTLALGGVGGPATLPFGKLPPFGKGFTGI